MYNYTPDKVLLKRLLKAKKKGRFVNSSINSSYEYELVKSIFPDFWTGLQFSMYWQKTNYFSVEKVSHVPVNGILFPVKYFNEKIVN